HMDHLVVRKREQEILRVRIKHAEGQPVELATPVVRVAFHELQGVVHPTHVPLEIETQSALARGVRDFRKGAGFLGNGHGAGILPVDRSEEHTSELQSRVDLVCRLLLEKKNKKRCTVV